MVMSRDIVSYVTCMFYFLCEIIITTKNNKFIYFSYIDTIISVYGIMFLSNGIINKITIRLFMFETVGFINISNISCILVLYVQICYLCY